MSSGSSSVSWTCWDRLGALDERSGYERGRQHTAVAITSRGVVALCLSWQGNFALASGYSGEALQIARGYRPSTDDRQRLRKPRPRGSVTR